MPFDYDNTNKIINNDTSRADWLGTEEISFKNFVDVWQVDCFFCGNTMIITTCTRAKCNECGKIFGVIAIHQ